MRYRLLAILLFLVQTICAQVSHQFRNTPLIDAIRTIEQGQTEYTVSILSDGLTHLTTSARIEEGDALRAIKSLCKGLGVKVKEKNGNIIPNRSLGFGFNMQPPPLVGEGGCYNTLFVYFTLHLKLLHVKARNMEYRFCASGVLRFPLDGDGLALSGQEVEVVVGILHGQNLLAVFAT